MIRVRAHPGASRDRLEWDGEVLHVWVTARAVAGVANRAMVRVIAEGLQARPAAVHLVAGERGRDKLVEVEGAFSSPLQPSSGR